GRADVRHQLRREPRQGPVALDPGRAHRRAGGVQQPLLPHPPRQGPDALGHRQPGPPRGAARRPHGAQRPDHRLHAQAARRLAEGDRRQARRHPAFRDVALARRSLRQRQPVRRLDAVHAGGRVRRGVRPGAAEVQLHRRQLREAARREAGEAERRPRRVRRRLGGDQVDAGPHHRPPVAVRAAAEDRPGAALGRHDSPDGELAGEALAVVQLRPRAKHALDERNGAVHGADGRQAVDQSRPRAERRDPQGAGVRRMNAVVLTLILGTATPGGGFPVYGEAFAETVNAQEPMLRVEPRNTKGSTENVPLLEAGQLDIALVAGEIATAALARPGTRLRIVAAMYSSPGVVIVRGDSPARGIADLRGQPVVLGTQASGITALGRTVLGSLEIEVQPIYLEKAADGPAMLIDGRAAAPWGAGGGWPAFTALAKSGGRFIAPSADEVQRILARQPVLQAVTLPARSYPGQDAALHS